MPSFCNSPWMRGAPQSGLAACICRISARMSDVHRGPARSVRPGFPPPVEREPASVPSHDRVGRDDLDRPSPVRPGPRQQHPQQAIGAAETRASRRLALEHGELMPEGENLRREVGTRLDRGSEGGEQSDEQRSHVGWER